MQRTLIKNATIVNEGRSLRGSGVIGSDGTLTGYGGGLDAKKYLLSLEQDPQSLILR